MKKTGGENGRWLSDEHIDWLTKGINGIGKRDVVGLSPLLWMMNDGEVWASSALTSVKSGTLEEDLGARKAGNWMIPVWKKGNEWILMVWKRKMEEVDVVDPVDGGAVGNAEEESWKGRCLKRVGDGERSK